MEGKDGVELFLLIFCILLYVGYNTWIYFKPNALVGGAPHQWFSVYGTSSTAKLLWTHGCAQEEKDAITAVQTLRNAIMVVALMTQATAYIGARALPEVLLNNDYSHSLLELAAIDPITGGSGRIGLVSSTGKLAVALALIWLCVLCLGQAARFYVHLGFMVKVVSSKYNTEHWNLEEETLMIANQAGLYFSVAWRVFYGFGLAILYLAGITSLLCSTIVLVIMLYFSDHLPRYKYGRALMHVKKGRRMDNLDRQSSQHLRARDADVSDLPV